MDFESVVISHSGCPDGAGAALAAYEKLGVRAMYLNGRYGFRPPSDRTIGGRDVYILDFSYPKAEIERMSKVAKSLVVVDHHKTAESDLRSLSNCYFDMGHSGATLSWAFFNRHQFNGEMHPEAAPEFFRYI